MNISALMESYEKNSYDRARISLDAFAISIAFIIRNFFMQKAPSLVLTLSCQAYQTCDIYHDILEAIYGNFTHSPFFQSVAIKHPERLYVRGNRQFNLIFVDSYASLEAIDLVSYTSEYDINEYYHIVMITPDNKLDRDSIQRVFEYCWANNMINCNVHVRVKRSESVIYSYYPFTRHGCRTVHIELINSFNGSHWMHNVIFPKKLLNFHGCPLYVGVWNALPFIYVEEYRNGSGIVRGGYEGYLILELAAILNFSIVVRVPPNDEQRGIIKGNNLTGVISMLHQRNIDLSLGCFRLQRDRAKLLTALTSYYQSSQIIAIPLAAYKLSSLEILVYPFSCVVWLLLLLIFIAGIAFIRSAERYGNSKHSCFTILVLALGMPITKLPEGNSIRLLMTDWMSFTLVMRTIYQAFIYHVIRTQVYSRYPISFDELIERNYTIMMNRATYLALESVPFLFNMDPVMIDDTDETIAFEYIKNHTRKNIAAAGPLDYIHYYMDALHTNNVFYILPQYIVGFPITMYMPKHSFLVDQFDGMVQRMRSVGLLQAWVRRAFEFSYKKYKRKQHKVFGIEELDMVFIIGFSGLAMATLVFALEIISKRYAVLQKLFRQIT